MKFLYIGQYTLGTTSRMRGQVLKAIIRPNIFEVIDTHVPFYKSHVLWRSLAFRYKKGPVINRINTFILSKLSGTYDLIWVDKAVFISPQVTNQLKSRTKKLIHYTPDTAFKGNKSKYFYKSLSFYDYVLTTKSFERADYLNHITKEKLLFIPQGFDKNVHYPRHTFQQKEPKVLFIGLYEPARGKVIKALLNQNIKVEVAGKNWMPFINAQNSSHLKFLGEGLFNDVYAKAISSAHLSLGLVSKRFPELHTTRTFEIPACGTVLVTERNTETSQFFNEDEVLFFSNEAEMIDKISKLLLDDEALQQITQKGYLRATTSGYDYQSQLLNICKYTGLLNNA